MEQQNRLGIHLTADRATAVVVGLHDQQVQAAFSVRTDEQASASLAEQIAQQLAARNLACAEVFVALDSSLITQHRLRSEFTDLKQIQATIRFDVEEALATDASGMAIASWITDRDDQGSDVAVFSADRALLAAFLDDLQAHDLDPTVIEPDLVCLARRLEEHPDPPAETTLFVLLAERACYIIGPAHAQGAPAVRSFLWSPVQDRSAVLSREIPLTLASWNGKHAVEHVALIGHTDGLDTERMAQAVHRPVHPVAVADLLPLAPAEMLDADPVGLLAACAAAPAPRLKQADLRSDFAPFLGKRVRVQRFLRVAAIALMILFCLLAFEFRRQAQTYKQHAGALWSKLEVDYEQAMMGKKPSEGEAPHKYLDRVLRGMKKDSRNVGDEDSIPARLTYILEAVNQAMGAEETQNPNAIDLQIQSLSLTTRTMKLTGTTGSRTQTMSLLNALSSHPRLNKVAETMFADGTRDGFTVTVELKKGA